MKLNSLKMFRQDLSQRRRGNAGAQTAALMALPDFPGDVETINVSSDEEVAQEPILTLTSSMKRFPCLQLEDKSGSSLPPPPGLNTMMSWVKDLPAENSTAHMAEIKARNKKQKAAKNTPMKEKQPAAEKTPLKKPAASLETPLAAKKKRKTVATCNEGVESRGDGYRSD